MTQLWVEKYRPTTADNFVGNKKALETLREYVRQFKKGKALLLHGPPGVGKSILPQIIAKEESLHLVEMNASDERGKEDIESYLSAVRTATLFAKGKMLVIDEVDGLAAGDRGGIQAIVNLIKHSQIPIIIIANDPYMTKLRPLKSHVLMVKFTKIPSPSIEKILREICQKEKIQVKGNPLKSLARFSDGDLRAAQTDLQLATVGKSVLEDQDLEVIGFRERDISVFDLLPTIYRSPKLSSARKQVYGGEKDPDEVFWWIENNAHLEFPKEKLSSVFDVLSKADIYRHLVIRQQNWGFKGYMVDIMVGVSVYGSPGHKYIPFRPPDRLLQLGWSKQRRALVSALAEKLGKELHCSKQVIKRDYLPFLKIILEKGKNIGLEKEDAEVILDR